jgi:hypothetical protein
LRILMTIQMRGVRFLRSRSLPIADSKLTGNDN